VRQPVRAPCELAPEEIEHIPWLRRRLLSWFARDGRTFPWREPGRTPYEVIVAEMLLQRTTATGVARSYAGFVERFPSWVALAQSSQEDLENALRPFGLWRRKAQAFQHLAQSIEEHRGVVPRTRAELEHLRGMAPTPRARSWPSCTGEPNRSSMSIWPTSWGDFLDHPRAPRQAPNARYTCSLFGWYVVNAASWSTGRRSISGRSSAVPGARCAPSARCGPGASMPGRGISNLLPAQMFFQAHEALVADDDVVDQLDVEDATSLHELYRRLDVLP
jgi:hypothetical protein